MWWADQMAGWIGMDSITFVGERGMELEGEIEGETKHLFASDLTIVPSKHQAFMRVDGLPVASRVVCAMS